MRTLLKDLTVGQARFVAMLARAARVQRDEVLRKAAEGDLGEIDAARGQHNPTAAFGFEPLAVSASQTEALLQAVKTLSARARSELYVLVRIGQGDLAAKQWHTGLAGAQQIGDETIMATIIEDPDLHDHIAKGLYETKLAS